MRNTGEKSMSTSGAGGASARQQGGGSNKSPANARAGGWMRHEPELVKWVLAVALLGATMGFGVGSGWLTLGSGSWQYLAKERRVLGAMSAKDGHVPERGARREFVVSAWRVDLAKRVRKTPVYHLMTFRKTPWRVAFDFCWGLVLTTRAEAEQPPAGGSRHWIASSPLWPPNWILFRDVDLSQINVGEGGLSPIFVSTLSFILPWRKNLIRALSRKDRVKVNIRGPDGNVIEPSLTSSISSVLSSAPSSQPVNPYYHPMAFHALREYVVRFDGGYVHPDLGFLVPAPSGAERGIGMVRDTFNKCQVHCYPGTSEEKVKAEMAAKAAMDESKRQAEEEKELMDEMAREFPGMATSTDGVDSSPPAGDSSQTSQQQPEQSEDVNPFRNTTTYAGIQAAVQLQSNVTTGPFTQTEVLIRIPLEAQITRKVAMETLTSLLTSEQTGQTNNLKELDDAFILALYLAHERGLGANSRIWPYIATLPLRPTCALHWGWRQSVVDVVTAMSVEMGTDVQGWPNELSKAAEMAERIVMTLSRSTSETMTNFATRTGAEDVTENIRWALCHVASRAVAGREDNGNLRLVPMMDMINHDEAASKFVELTGKERIADGSFVDANEDDAGTFVVRSYRHGEKKSLRRGQELMANYNVPHYSPLDWFINMGYIPPERSGKWVMLESGLPRSFRGGFSGKPQPVVRDVGSGPGKAELHMMQQRAQSQSSR